MSDIKKVQKQIATILKRTLNVRDYPINLREDEDPYQKMRCNYTAGFNHGLSLALAMLVLSESGPKRKGDKNVS